MKKLSLIILFVLLFFSCKNPMDNKNTKKGYGVISFTSSARTVQENFNVETLTDICLFGKNIGEESDFVSLKSWDKYENFLSDSLSIAVGSYKFYITAKIGNVRFESDVVSVDIAESSINIINFKVYVTDRGTGKGTVDLEFTFGGFPVTYGSFELNKITYEDNVRNSQKINDIDQSALFVTPYDGVNKTDASATFNAELDSGVYELISRFENPDVGVAVYPVTIHISEGQTSSDEIEVLNFNPFYDITYYDGETPFADLDDTYYPTKYSIYDEITFRPLDAKDTYNPFQGWYTDDNVKIEKISKYERTGDLLLSAKWHLDSQYMLFSKVEPSPNSERYTSFEMTSDLSSRVETPINVEGEVIDFTIGGGNFYYYITKSSEEVFLRRTDKEAFKISIPVDSAYVNTISNYIYWDYEFDKLYVLQIKIDDVVTNNNTIEKVLLYDPKNAEAPFVYFPITNDYSNSLIKNSYSTYDFAVHNDKLYIGFSNPDKGLYVSEFKINQNDISFIKDIQVDSHLNYNNNPISLNDMIWMNDSLYLLWSSNGDSSSEIAYTYQSYGYIFRMTETEDNEYSIPELNLPSKTTFEINYNDEVTRHCYYHGPSSENDNNYLFGPTKFIAIKPKKLVVADEGILIYIDENDSNKIKMKNIDRVVELDLDINSITPTILHDITFNKESVEGLQIVHSLYLYLTEDGLKVVE